MWAHAFLLESHGKVAAAFALLDECWDRCAQSGLTLDYRAFGPDLVRLALANGEWERGRNVAAAIAEIAEQNEVASLAGAALRCVRQNATTKRTAKNRSMPPKPSVIPLTRCC